MDFTTNWTYDFDKVISGYSSISVLNGLGWSLKGSNVYGPGRNNNDRDWDFTGVAQFALIVAGMDIDDEAVTTMHDVKYNGTYAWKFL